MTNSTKELVSADGQQDSSCVQSTEVKEALTAILQSPPFRSSKQIQKLLQFIVSETLAGRADTLKERNIGASIFDRRPDYDTNNDPTVRLRVAELRKRLALYYQASPEETILISIPSGSFRAVFDRSGITGPRGVSGFPQHDEQARGDGALMSPPARDTSEAEHFTNEVPRHRNRNRWISIAASLAILVIALLVYYPSSQERVFVKFWGPVLQDSHPVLVHIGNNTVYELSSSFLDEYFRQHPRDADHQLGFETYVTFPPGTNIPAEDLRAAKDLYHTNGDVTATIAITSALVRRNKPFDVRYGSDISYGDLREHPAILIGAHNNFWTLSMTQNLRFGFSGHDGILDHSTSGKHWVGTPDGSEDYAILSRVLNSANGRAFISVAGIGHAGTCAAAEFLTNPRSLSALEKALPKDWERKNLQLVLHTTVKNQVPSAADVVATYSW